MRIASQIVVYAASFLVVFILGNFFDTAFWQAGIHIENTFHGRPVAVLSEFFITHRHLPAHLALLPWLGFVGIPLLTLAGSRSYWAPRPFVLRYLAFLSLELLLFLVLLFALALPFIPYYGVLEPFRQSAIELAVRGLFWIALVAIVLIAIRRAIQIRAHPKK